ncbi:arsenate reductase ArsC [Candidatus Thioglobus sp.]|nr:arsenate reductase ArsC [Candidatus Thioglobus sp.]
MMKKVLVLCTGNSCRSIIAEALINSELGDRIEGYSSGVSASGLVNPHAKKILEIKNIWKDEYHSKRLETLLYIDFDLVITVCDNASQTCPIFPGKTEIVHLGFDDPDGKDFEEFESCYKQVKAKLIPLVKYFLN